MGVLKEFESTEHALIDTRGLMSLYILSRSSPEYDLWHLTGRLVTFFSAPCGFFSDETIAGVAVASFSFAEATTDVVTAIYYPPPLPRPTPPPLVAHR